MKKIFTGNIYYKIIITAVVFLGIPFLFNEYSRGDFPSFLFWFSVIGAIVGVIMVWCLRIEVSDENIQSFCKVFGKRFFLIYDCPLSDVEKIKYTRTTFVISRGVGQKPIMISTLYENYIELLRHVIEKAPQVIIEPSARKKLVRDGVLKA